MSRTPEEGPRPRPTYDLATLHADYPQWEGKPRRTILVCTHMRSGSTLLGEAMYASGRLGCPIEYFHRGFQPYLAQRWQTVDCPSYLDAVYAHRTDPAGTMAVKLFWRDVEDLCIQAWPECIGRLDGELTGATPASTYRRIYALLEQLFPNPRFVYLRRLDRLRQAVSLLRASQTGVFREFRGVEAEPSGEPEYNYEKILYYLALGDYSHSHWLELFRTAALDPYRITYEDLFHDFQISVRGLFDCLDAGDAPIPAPRLERQADRLSEEYLARFLKDYRSRNGD